MSVNSSLSAEAGAVREGKVGPLHESEAALILEGQVYALFAFDVGYEVSLEKLNDLIDSIPIRPLSGKKRTPTFLQYARPPHVLILSPETCVLDRPCQVQATIFDFGAISLAYSFPLVNDGALPVDELPRLSRILYGSNLEADACARALELTARIAPAITRPGLAALTEDYYLFVIERLNQPLPPDKLLAEKGPALAQTLRFDTTPLSREQQNEALGQRLSYYENDLLLMDWNAAIICDQDYEDTVRVLELLNVELLEARYIDAQLDRRIEEYSDLVGSHTEWPIPLRTPFRRAILEITEMRAESALLAERSRNALKLIGDLYLARVHAAAAERCYLREWEGVIAHKLNVIDGFYHMLTDRLRTAQNQALELVIITLILVELLLAVFARLAG